MIFFCLRKFVESKTGIFFFIQWRIQLKKFLCHFFLLENKVKKLLHCYWLNCKNRFNLKSHKAIIDFIEKIAVILIGFKGVLKWKYFRSFWAQISHLGGGLFSSWGRFGGKLIKNLTGQRMENKASFLIDIIYTHTM